MHAGWKGIVLSVVVSLIAFTGLTEGRTIAINEVAWGGVCGDSTGEWIELVNLTDDTIDLEGWRLVSSDGNPEISLTGTIDPLETESDRVGGYYLLERDDDDAVPGIEADLIYTGALYDGGEALSLIDPKGRVIDTANQEGGPWPAGTDGELPCTMERVDPTGADEPANWATSPSPSEEGGLLCGTPRAENSVFNIPPYIAFSVFPRLVHPGDPVSLDASGSSDKGGEITSYLWDFGDGTLGEGQTASHTYAEIGTYTIILTVKDDKGGGAQGAKEVLVIINEPPQPDFSVKSASQNRVLQSLDELLFFDESYDPDGAVVGWRWDFGDGEIEEGQTASHTYTCGGDYVVTLCVTDDQGEIACRTQAISLVSRKPVARFAFTPKSPNEGEDVTFDAVESFDLDGTVVRYDWDFDGDGEVDLSTDQPTAVHPFPGGGEHEVTLRVIDDQGMISLPYSGKVYINRRPVAAFQVSNFSTNELEEVSFTDCSHDPDGEVVAWHWDFGDDETGDGQAVSHTYPSAGEYTITLTVTDENGAQGEVTTLITVKNLPPAAHLEVAGKKGKVEVFTNEPVILDGSTSKDQSPNGQVVLYEWDLGADGTYEETTTSPTFSCTYTEDGTYKVRLRVTDDNGATALSNPLTIVVLNRAPTCSFNWSPASPSDAEEAIFSAVVSDPDGEVVGWRWYFGDGETSTAESPTHRFPDDGVYTVTLIVRDDDGKESRASVREITVKNASPIAKFSLSSTSPQIGDLVCFTDLSYDPSPTGEIAHVAWDFGDGTFCPGTPNGCGEGGVRSPTHIYTVAGSYTVTLSVIDEEGAIGFVTQTLSIAEMP